MVCSTFSDVGISSSSGSMNVSIHLLQSLLRIIIWMLHTSPNQAVIMEFLVADGVSSAQIFERMFSIFSTEVTIQNP
jgi:hypothetical protein